MVMCVVGAGSAALAQPAALPSIGTVRFAGDAPFAAEMFDALSKDERSGGTPADALCACLLEVRRIAESQGRIDFSVAIETNGTDEPIDVTTHVRMGSPYRVGRIDFTGHGAINDSTLRRALTVRERDLFDVTELRRSLARLNGIGLAGPLTLADIVVTRNADGAMADLTIPLHERRRRWWSLSGPIIPGLGSYQASISSRLPPWGRGVLDASTYVVSFNLLAAARPLVGLLPFLSKTPPALVSLERPYLPGQGLLSGFAWSPAFSPRTTLVHYGRSQLGRGVRALLGPLEEETTDPLAVPIVGSDGPTGKFLVCHPPKPRWAWLRRGVIQASDLALAAVLP